MYLLKSCRTERIYLIGSATGSWARYARSLYTPSVTKPMSFDIFKRSPKLPVEFAIDRKTLEKFT